MFWKAITIGGNQYLIGCENIPSYASFDMVKTLWIEVIKKIKEGEYDEYFAGGVSLPNSSIKATADTMAIA